MTPLCPLGSDKPRIDYPTTWTYKVIGTSKEALEQAIRRSVGEREHELELSRRSAGARYVSLKLEVLVEDEASRLGIFEALQADEVVRFVL